MSFSSYLQLWAHYWFVDTFPCCLMVLGAYSIFWFNIYMYIYNYNLVKIMSLTIKWKSELNKINFTLFSQLFVSGIWQWIWAKIACLLAWNCCLLEPWANDSFFFLFLFFFDSTTLETRVKGSRLWVCWAEASVRSVCQKVNSIGILNSQSHCNSPFKMEKGHRDP